MTDIAGHATHTHTHTAHKALDNPNRFHPKNVFSSLDTQHTGQQHKTLWWWSFFCFLFLCNSKSENKKTKSKEKKTTNKVDLVYEKKPVGIEMQTDLTSMKTVSHWQESTTRRTRRVKWRRATPRLATLLQSIARIDDCWVGRGVHQQPRPLTVCVHQKEKRPSNQPQKKTKKNIFFSLFSD